jgi:predicted nucleic acid-binding protein
VPRCAGSMTKVLLDTDILSEILKGKNAVVAARAGAGAVFNSRRFHRS